MARLIAGLHKERKRKGVRFWDWRIVGKNGSKKEVESVSLIFYSARQLFKKDSEQEKAGKTQVAKSTKKKSK